jgi:hypothetical protein
MGMNSLQQQALTKYQRMTKGQGLAGMSHLHNIRQLVFDENITEAGTAVLEHFLNNNRTNSRSRNTVYMLDRVIESVTTDQQLHRLKIRKKSTKDK